MINKNRVSDRVTACLYDNYGNFIRKLLRYSVAVVICLFIIVNEVVANPEGGSVSAGGATISQPNTTTVQINQTTNKAVIDWRSFNIAPNEHTQFQQPSASAITLNRIDPTHGVSQINGRLTANGQIWLINPAGIFFGHTARVDVAGLLATTANITNEDFLSGNYKFIQSDDWNGAIINEGEITVAERGLAALVAPGVENRGVIRATLGNVVLAAGSQFTLDFYGDNLINFTIDTPVKKAAVDKNGNTLDAGVSNKGTIFAKGGTVMLTANTAETVLDKSINMSGHIVATTVRQRGGVIVLSGGSMGKVYVTGKMNASGKKSQQKGGKIYVTGKSIIVADNAKLDVSGSAGGGEILIGGDYQGKNPAIHHAQQTFIGSRVKLDANALVNGNGGKVIVWADDTTQFYGNISARGGLLGGQGGFVETSGKEILHIVGGQVDASAPLGLSGQWLLDPRNVTIAAATSGGTFDGGDPNVFTPTANSATVDVATINTALNGGTSVTITTGITGTQAGTITLTNAIQKTLSSVAIPTLTLNAASAITLNNNITASAGSMNVNLIGNSVTIGGTANSAITTNGGNFTSTTQNGFTMSNAGGTVTGTINVGDGSVNISANQDATGAGNFLMNPNSSITSTNNTAGAVSILVNTIAGGTATAGLRNISTGSTGSLIVTTDGITTDSNTVGNATGGTLTLNSGSTLSGGNILLRTPGAMTYSGIINTQGTVSLRANTDGSGASALTMGNLSKITTTSAASDAIKLLVNNTAGGTGSASLSEMNTGTGGTITVATDNGGNSTGTDILWTSGVTNPLNTGVGGTVSLSSAKITNNNIGTVALPILTNTSNLNATSGSSGIFVTNSGSNSLTVNTLQAANTSDVATGSAQIFSNGSIVQGTNPVNITTLTLKTLNNLGAAITFNHSSNKATTINLKARNLADSANASGAINYTDTDGVIISGLNTASTLDLTVGAAVSETAAMDVGGIATFTTTAATTNFLLNTQTNNFDATPVFTTSGAGTIQDIGLRNTNAGALVPTLPASFRNLILAFDNAAIVLPTVTLTGTLTATANGSISQSSPTDALLVTGVTTLTAGSANNISLESANNNFVAALAIVSANNVILQDLNALILGANNITGTLDVTTGGALTDSGVIVVGGATTINAGANAVTLNTAGNNFNTVTLTNSGNATLVDTNAMVLGASNVTGTLNITTNGHLTQSGGATTVTGATRLASGAANDITLDTFSNEFSTVGITTGNNVTLKDTSGLIVGASTVSGNFDVTANGNITQSGVITMEGAGTPTFTVTAPTSNILLSTQANNFNVTPILTTSGGGTLQDIGLRNTNAGAQIPTLPASFRNLTLTFNNAAMALPAVSLSGTLSATSNGAMTQSGTLTMTGLTTLNSNANAITLNTAANNFSTIKVTSGSAVNLRDANSLILDDINATSSLTIQTNGALTQAVSKAITAGGTTTLIAGAANSITLNNSGNNFSTVNITSGNNVALTDTNALTLGASTVSGTFGVRAGGTISQTGILAIHGIPTFTVTTPASDILLASAANTFVTVPTFTNNGNIHDLAYRIASGSTAVPTIPSGLNNLTLIYDSAGITLPTLTIASTLSATATGAITQSGALIGSALVVKTLNNTANASPITLDTVANEFSSIDLRTRNAADTANVSSGIHYQDSTGFNINNISTGASVTGVISLTAHDVISQTGAITGNALIAKTLNNSGAAITLNNSANTVSHIDLRSRNSADTAFDTGAIAFTATNDIDVNTIGTLSTIALNAGGAITDSGAITGSTLTTNSVNGTTLDFGATLTGFAATNTTSGNISLVNTGALAVNAVNQTGGDFFLTNTGTVSVGNGVVIHSGNADINITATDLDIANSSSIVSGSGNISITQNTVGGSIGLGNTSGTMTISGSELSRFSANHFTLNAPSNGQIIVDGITSANSNSLSTVILNATTGANGSVTFQNTSSLFNALSASADALHLNANLTSLGDLILSALNGEISLESNANLSGTQLTFNQQISGAKNLTLIGDNAVGPVNVAGLNLNTQFANLTGFVNGLSGRAAIDIIVLLNSISPGTHYFDGIDMFQEPPSPPTPVVPPIEPSIVTAEQRIVQYIFPNSTSENSYVNILWDIKPAKGSHEKKTNQHCIIISSNIEICS